jgi:hypothetical protein
MQLASGQSAKWQLAIRQEKQTSDITNTHTGAITMHPCEPAIPSAGNWGG